MYASLFEVMNGIERADVIHGVLRPWTIDPARQPVFCSRLYVRNIHRHRHLPHKQARSATKRETMVDAKKRLSRRSSCQKCGKPRGGRAQRVPKTKQTNPIANGMRDNVRRSETLLIVEGICTLLRSRSWKMTFSTGEKLPLYRARYWEQRHFAPMLRTRLSMFAARADSHSPDTIMLMVWDRDAKLS